MTSREMLAPPQWCASRSDGFQPPVGGWKPPLREDALDHWPRWLRTLLLAVATVILCSCRTPKTASVDPFQQRDEVQANADVKTTFAEAPVSGAANSSISLASAEMPLADTIPIGASLEPPPTRAAALPHVAQRHDASMAALSAGCWCSACSGPRFKLPPSDEILCDGGDDGLPAVVIQDGSVAGLELEDTVAHYKTHDGQTIIQPTNEVCLYAPRFASVRQIRGASVNINRRGAEGLAKDVTLVGAEDSLETSTTLQNQQPLAGVVDRPTSLLRGRQQQGGLENDQGIARATGREGTLVDQRLLQFVLIDNRQQPLLVGGMINAIQWTHDLGVQVVIENKGAQVVTGDQQAAVFYRVEESPEPRLSVVKLADRSSAHPGDTVHFALKYENVGNRPISELTLVDNLTTRLEYVEGSQVSDRPADFTSEMNDGGSLKMRWSLPQPLEPGQSGIIEFDCRVR